MRSRLFQIMWEIDMAIRGKNPNGHSVTQRLEFWRAGWGIARQHPLIGVGTGDMKQAYQQQYDAMKSALDKSHRLRAHNQFLAIMVAFGISGLIYFLYALVYPVIRNTWRMNFLFTSFFLISIFSMLPEDTLETQAGATFVALFFALFLSGNPYKQKEPAG
jgi:O-antigen ligase